MDLNATLLVESLFFLSFLWLSMKYVWPPIDAVLKQRQTDIQIAIERARASEKELERAHDEAKKIINEAKMKADTVLIQAKKDADIISRDIKSDAMKAAEDAMGVALKKIEVEKNIAKDELKKEVAKSAIMMLQNVLGKEQKETENLLFATLTDEELL